MLIGLLFTFVIFIATNQLHLKIYNTVTPTSYTFLYKPYTYGAYQYMAYPYVYCTYTVHYLFHIPRTPYVTHLNLGKKITRVAEYPGMQGKEKLWNPYNQILHHNCITFIPLCQITLLILLYNLFLHNNYNLTQLLLILLQMLL